MKNNRKLIYILNYVDPKDSQHFVHTLRMLRDLKKIGWSVIVISERGGVGKKKLEGLDIIYLSKSSKFLRVIRLIACLVVLRFRGYKTVFVRISRPAAIITFPIVRLLGGKGLYWLSGTVLDYDNGKGKVVNFFDNIIMKFIVNTVHKFITGPEFMVDYYKTNFGLENSKVGLLYNDIEVALYSVFNRPLSADSFTALMVHRLSPVRQTDLYFEHILDALSSVSSSYQRVYLNVVGDGPELDLLKEIAERFNSRVVVNFAGSIPNSELLPFYSSADIFLMPSYREGFPRVILEAMAASLPVVSTDAGGVLDIVGPRQKEFVVSRDDPLQFANRVIDLANSRPLREQLSQENSLSVQKFDTSRVVKMFENLLVQNQ